MAEGAALGAALWGPPIIPDRSVTVECSARYETRGSQLERYTDIHALHKPWVADMFGDITAGPWAATVPWSADKTAVELCSDIPAERVEILDLLLSLKPADPSPVCTDCNLSWTETLYVWFTGARLECMPNPELWSGYQLRVCATQLY